jgi:histidine triad (HIT) family protein
MVENCLFCKIVAGDIPSKKAYEDDKILAFYDIAPQAPVHILVIPKAHIASVDEIGESNADVVAHIFTKIPSIAKDAGITGGYRVVSNCGADACQSVKHLHFHILGGAQLSCEMA